MMTATAEITVVSLMFFFMAFPLAEILRLRRRWLRWTVPLDLTVGQCLLQAVDTGSSDFGTRNPQFHEGGHSLNMLETSVGNGSSHHVEAVEPLGGREPTLEGRGLRLVFHCPARYAEVDSEAASRTPAKYCVPGGRGKLFRSIFFTRHCRNRKKADLGRIANPFVVEARGHELNFLFSRCPLCATRFADRYSH